MHKKIFVFFFALMAISIILMGCSPKSPATPTSNPDLIYTAAAKAANATLTQIFKLTPSATPVTPSPTFNLTQTAAARTASAMLTQAAGLTQTPSGSASSTPAPTGSSGDRAVFVADVTIPDGTVIAPGAAFTKTWKLQNGGISTWTTSYSLAFVSGEQMGSITSVRIDQSVVAGQQIDVSVDMVAPTKTGTYQGYWKMKNASGQFFNDPVYVLIAVGSGGATPPSGTPQASPTATNTGIPTNPISSLNMSVDQATYQGECPHTFNFAAALTLSQGATLTYKLEASSDTPGFQFNLPGPQTSTFGPGTYSLPFTLSFTSDGTGYVWFHVTSPVDVSSNHVQFTLDCTP